MCPLLLRFCAALWVLGMIGMGLARAVFALEPWELGFRCAAGLWIVGGLGYTGLGLLGFLALQRSGPRDPQA